MLNESGKLCGAKMKGEYHNCDKAKRKKANFSLRDSFLNKCIKFSGMYGHPRSGSRV